MKLKDFRQIGRLFLPLLLIFLNGCSDSQKTDAPDDAAALAKASAVVDELTRSLEIDYEISAQTWDGVPMIVMEVDDPKSDYQSVIGAVTNAPAVRSFEGDLHLAFEMPTEPPDRKQDPPYLGGKLILGVFDAKTGERLP
jgi:hypothetical protein